MSWGRRRNDYWGGWPPTCRWRRGGRLPANRRRSCGRREMPLSPVVVAGRTIAATFWGKAWCQNLERYGDYENRIPRGRAYVRNGSVLDLKIGTARVDALVSGSHLYSVAVEIRPLQAKVWKEVKGACTGRIGSLLELLQGKLSGEVMEIVTRPANGALPAARRDLFSAAPARTGPPCASTSPPSSTASAPVSTRSRNCSSACATWTIGS